ncbi:MAG: hypothetical protein AAGA28_13800 [Pseudomonadota bacterium]
MGFPFDTPSWDGVSGPIFMGTGTSMPGIFTLIAIAVCIAALAFGNSTEASKYRKHK